MGNAPSTHQRIYHKLLAMQSPAMRIQMLQTLLVAPEYIQSAKTAGVYGPLLQYIATGGSVPFPGETQQNQIVSPAVAAVQAIQQRQGGGAGGMGGAGNMGAGTYGAGNMGAAGTYGAGNMGAAGPHRQIQQYQEPQQSAWQIVTATPTNKALNYFQQCLVVLGLNEDENLTDERLKAAYKRAAIRVHPDKGGTEQQFEAVTRAYAYLADILKRIIGTRKTTGALDAPAITTEARAQEDKRWDMKPVRIDPKNLNMTTFNSMFEQTRLPDPDDDGYGDWLKGGEAAEEQGPKFSGKFNRDVFMKTFEDEARRKAATSQIVLHPEMMALNSSSSGVEIGRGKAETFTAPANASLKYTDLRDAYTKENTISPQVANVRVEERNLKEYSNQYKAGPRALTAHELQQLEGEKQQRLEQDNVRARRVAEDSMAAQAYFEKMKQLLITK